MPSDKKHSFKDLVNIMQQLRTPVTGCPWDLDQDFDTIAPHTIEEAYEVQNAIQKKDYDNLKEELGDLLFQPIFHAQIAKDKNLFDIHDIVHDVADKMITRHPHVFGDLKAKDSNDVDQIWDNQKDKEKQTPDESILDSVPLNFPALLRAHKMQKKVAKVGFEWDDLNGVLDKLNEEISELKEALETKKTADIKDELGDVFFVLVNFARMSGYNAEDIMRAANDKFERRFRGVEKTLKNNKIDINQASLEQMEEAWKNIKKNEKTDT